MSETTIDNMPEEVLLEVFKWLDLQSLENVEDPSEEWEKIARSIPRTLRLDDKDMEASLDSLLVSRRNYDKAVIRGKVESQHKLLEVFTKHGANVRHLEIRSSTLNDATIWCQVLKSMPQLKKVSIWNSRSGESWNELNSEDLPKEKDLSKMESLELQRSDVMMLKLFEKCQVKTLSVRMSPNRESLLNFLAIQKNLEELTLTFNENLFATPIPNELIPLRLKKLVLRKMSGSYDTLNHNHLLEFMKLHAATLQELELNSKFSDFVFEFVFGKLKRLKTLKLICTAIPHDSGFYERLEVNESVTSLQLDCVSDEHSLALKGLIRHLPNIESLSFLWNRYGGFFIKHVAETLKKLKKLDVTYFNGQTFDRLRFEALESLEIFRVDGPVNWGDFTRNNPAISELSIGYMPQHLLDIAAITKNLKKLHTLTIKSELNCDENFFANIRRNCKELKSLDLNVKGLKVDISTVANIPGLRFRNF